MSGDIPLAEMTVSDVLAKWPQTAAVFHYYDMACVGCVFAPFYTTTDAANVYGLPPDEFIAKLKEIINGQDTPSDA